MKWKKVEAEALIDSAGWVRGLAVIDGYSVSPEVDFSLIGPLGTNNSIKSDLHSTKSLKKAKKRLKLQLKELGY